MNTPGSDDRFDDAMRHLHVQAVPQVSTGTMAELHRRRHAVLAGQSRPRRLLGWPIATAFASVLAVAIGLGIGLHDTAPETSEQPLPMVATDAPADAAGEDTLATLDENPEFFLWLASSDATLLAME